jgi:hypothetical protein
MQMKRAKQLQEEWGDKSCPHPVFAKAYDAGVKTGEFICTQCGRVFTFRERSEIRQARGE